MNKVILAGNIGIKPELTVVGDTIKTTLRIATKHLEQGGKKKVTTWHFVTVWGKQADLCCKFLEVGSRAIVEAHLKNNQWTEDDGRNRHATEIVADNVEFLGIRSSDRKEN